jgi:hypothetical protein
MAVTKEGSPMQKKYLVRLTHGKRATLAEVVK